MDDITTTTETMVQTSYLLDKLIPKLHWAGLYEKVEKCRALVIIKGQVSSRRIEINGKPIQSIQEEPVRFLGKWYNASLGEKEQIEGIVKVVKADLKKVEKCRLPGRYKAWMVQHMLMPRLMWPLSIYNVPDNCRSYPKAYYTVTEKMVRPTQVTFYSMFLFKVSKTTVSIF